jgi:tRNA threonylcarbamoyladenosine modification (KEOPS) complex  Pcc1 subunit
MNSNLEINTDYAEQVASSVSPSMRSNNRVEYSTEPEETQFFVGIEADKLGVLRGSTDSSFRLIMLADKIYSKEV